MNSGFNVGSATAPDRYKLSTSRCKKNLGKNFLVCSNER